MNTNFTLNRSIKLQFMLVFILILTLSAACAKKDDQIENTENLESADNSPLEAEYHKLAQEDAKKIMDSGEPYTLVDVRTQEEYDAGHINGAILIPVNEIKDRAEGELPDKSALILVYCRSGARSRNAAGILVELGYVNVQDIGGISSWPYDNVTE